jgi:hypothetical protein
LTRLVPMTPPTGAAASKILLCTGVGGAGVWDICSVIVYVRLRSARRVPSPGRAAVGFQSWVFGGVWGFGGLALEGASVQPLRTSSSLLRAIEQAPPGTALGNCSLATRAGLLRSAHSPPRSLSGQCALGQCAFPRSRPVPAPASCRALPCKGTFPTVVLG